VLREHFPHAIGKLALKDARSTWRYPSYKTRPRCNLDRQGYVSGYRKNSSMQVLAQQQDRQGSMCRCRNVYTLLSSSCRSPTASRLCQIRVSTASQLTIVQFFFLVQRKLKSSDCQKKTHNIRHPTITGTLPSPPLTSLQSHYASGISINYRWILTFL